MLKRVKVIKSLGLMIDETLTWDEQVTLIAKKVNKGLNVLRRLRDFFDIKILTTVYQTLVQPTRYEEALVPAFVINFSDYKTELFVSLQRVDTKFDLKIY